jgi:CBS domain-containing protein
VSNKRKIKRKAGVIVRPVINAGTDRDIAEIFGGVGGEPLTDLVVAELVGRGWGEPDLLTAQQKGARYNRRRDSLIFDDDEHSGSFGF